MFLSKNFLEQDGDGLDVCALVEVKKSDPDQGRNTIAAVSLGVYLATLLAVAINAGDRNFSPLTAIALPPVLAFFSGLTVEAWQRVPKLPLVLRRLVYDLPAVQDVDPLVAEKLQKLRSLAGGDVDGFADVDLEEEIAELEGVLNRGRQIEEDKIDFVLYEDVAFARNCMRLSVACVLTCTGALGTVGMTYAALSEDRDLFLMANYCFSAAFFVWMLTKMPEIMAYLDDQVFLPPTSMVESIGQINDLLQEADVILGSEAFSAEAWRKEEIGARVDYDAVASPEIEAALAELKAKVALADSADGVNLAKRHVDYRVSVAVKLADLSEPVKLGAKLTNSD